MTCLASLSSAAYPGRNLVFHKAFCRANELPLLKAPFQKDPAEIGQCPFFSGGELFKLGPRCLADPHADLDSPFAHCANLSVSDAERFVELSATDIMSDRSCRGLLDGRVDGAVDGRCEVPPDPQIRLRGVLPGDDRDHVGGLHDGLFARRRRLSRTLFSFHVPKLPSYSESLSSCAKTLNWRKFPTFSVA